ncbi:MAG: hypothetical protein LBL47_03645 [Lactobacillus sp.]|jgi:phosphate butyryltransferase|nr:hypothetical protein [Lactobacillus sp.]
MKNFEEIKSILKDAEKKNVLVVACAHELNTLMAVDAVVNEGIVDAILVGDSAEIKALCRDNEIDAGKYEIVHCIDGGTVYSEATKVAIALIKEGKADILMKGIVSTKKFVRTIINRTFGLPHDGFVSHVTVYEWIYTGKFLFVSDVAVNKYPNFNDKKKIVHSLVRVMDKFKINSPKVAVMVPSEIIDEDNIREAVFADAITLKDMSDKQEFHPAIVEPSSLDMAWSEAVAKTKNFKGNIAGDVDAVLLHDYIGGNVFYKLEEAHETPAAGVLCGASAPVVLPSRGDSPETKANSIALAAFLKWEDIS